MTDSTLREEISQVGYPGARRPPGGNTAPPVDNLTCNFKPPNAFKSHIELCYHLRDILVTNAERLETDAS